MGRIIVNLDVEMAKRKISLGELSERVGLTQATYLNTGTNDLDDLNTLCDLNTLTIYWIFIFLKMPIVSIKILSLASNLCLD